LWLPEVWTKLVRHCGGKTHHGFLLLNSSYVLFGFWVRFGAMASSMIFAVEVWVFGVLILNFRGPLPLRLPLDAKPPLVLDLLCWLNCGFSTC
jgi:hypothetical protein